MEYDEVRSRLAKREKKSTSELLDDLQKRRPPASISDIGSIDTGSQAVRGKSSDSKPPSPSPKSGRYNAALLSIIVVLLLCIAGMGGYFVGKGGNTNNAGDHDGLSEIRNVRAELSSIYNSPYEDWPYLAITFTNKSDHSFLLDNPEEHAIVKVNGTEYSVSGSPFHNDGYTKVKTLAPGQSSFKLMSFHYDKKALKSGDKIRVVIDGSVAGMSSGKLLFTVTHKEIDPVHYNAHCTPNEGAASYLP